MNWFVILFIASLAPIWRGAGHSRLDGISFWQYFSEAACVQQTHLPVDEAVYRAQQAYQELHGGTQ